MSSTNPLFRVLKFGGAALADGPRVRRACEIVTSAGGPRPVVIVSALEGVTAILEALGLGIGETRSLRIRHRSLLHQLDLPNDLLDPFLRELESLVAGLRNSGEVDQTGRDHLLSFGERMSARIVAACLRARGHSATPVDAHDLGMITDNRDGEVRLLASTSSRVRAAIEEVPGIPVVTGFLAADQRGNLTTLGSNGSDLTALFVAEAIEAEELQLWKSVAGIQTADPKLVREAHTIEELGFAEAIEIARLGARVLHHGAAVEASRAGLALSLRFVEEPDSPGTRLVESTPHSGPVAIVHRQLGEEGADLSIVGAGVGADENLRLRVSDWLAAAEIEARNHGFGERASSLSWRVSARVLERALNLLHDSLFGGLASGASRSSQLEQSPPN